MQPKGIYVVVPMIIGKKRLDIKDLLYYLVSKYNKLWFICSYFVNLIISYLEDTNDR